MNNPRHESAQKKIMFCKVLGYYCVSHLIGNLIQYALDSLWCEHPGILQSEREVATQIWLIKSSYCPTRIGKIDLDTVYET